MSFAIVTTDSRTGSKFELCRVGTNPEAIAKAARAKTYELGKKKRKARLYSCVEIVKVDDFQPQRPE